MYNIKVNKDVSPVVKPVS